MKWVKNIERFMESILRSVDDKFGTSYIREPHAITRGLEDKNFDAVDRVRITNIEREILNTSKRRLGRVTELRNITATIKQAKAALGIDEDKPFSEIDLSKIEPDSTEKKQAKEVLMSEISFGGDGKRVVKLIEMKNETIEDKITEINAAPGAVAIAASHRKDYLTSQGVKITSMATAAEQTSFMHEVLAEYQRVTGFGRERGEAQEGVERRRGDCGQEPDGRV